ncbi:TIGR02646 family protein [Candidatus Palauibacter sp.]|uniref:TIGR02646 family protein n=1 Tax=Candidatus Palauibacter sp. TaxID=3101350 RepID=UPI003D0D0954
MIAKGREPPSLTAHRQTSHSSYENYQEKDELRNALVTEQRGLCCYCMGRIKPDRTAMKIEHWQCRARHPGRELAYRNLLAACPGRLGDGVGQPARLQHCDTRKGDSDLKWNPAEPAHRVETRIRYGSDGSIRSNDVSFNEQLNDVLNLNLPVLKRNREGVLEAVLQWWKHEKAQIRGPVPRERIVRERDRYATGGGELTPYCQVAVWWLNEKLARMAA